jgi:uncharacterized protein YuzE
MGGLTMNVFYNDKTDLLYIRIDSKKQDVVNKRISEEMVIDIGEDQKIVGIEIMEASKHVDLKKILPVEYEVAL